MTLKNLLLPAGLTCALFGTAIALGVSCGDSKSSGVDAGATGGAAGGSVGGAGAVAGNAGNAGTAGGAGTTGGAGGGATVGSTIVISGAASPFPGDPETDFTSLALVVADPLDVLMGKPELAKMAPFDTTTAICPGAACVVPFSFPAVPVDPTKSVLGLIAIMQDLRPIASGGAVAAKWVRTGTGIANTAQLAAAVASGSLPGRPVYAVSKTLEAKLSEFAGAVSGGDGGVGAPGSLASKGFVLAMILANGSPKPTPVEGATFGPKDPNNAAKFSVIYPNATMTGAGTSTSATGLVLIYPNVITAQAPVTPWTVTPPSGSTATWPDQIVGVQADGAVVLLDVSN